MSALNSGTYTVTEQSQDASPLIRSRNMFLAAGVLGLILAAILGFSAGGGIFFESWLYAFMMWVSAALGCFIMLTIVHLAGGSWGSMIMRPLEAGVATLPLLAILVIPVLLGIGHLYPWSDQAYVDATPLVGAKASMLNTPFFIVRTVLYFAIWIFGGWYFLRKSDQADRDATGDTWFRLKGQGGLWLAILIMTFTFAAIDWTKSLTPEWFSGIYPAILMSGQAVMAVALMVLVTIGVSRFNPVMDRLLTTKRLQDLGNFLMAFLMFWAYLSISQLMIIWSNNTVETSGYYVDRITGPWEPVAVLITVFGFFAPFVILFSRWVKRKRLALGLVALWAVGVRMLDLYWIIVPSFGRADPEFRWLDILMVVAMGAVWVGYYLHRLASRPMVPANDPRLKGVLDNGQ